MTKEWQEATNAYAKVCFSVPLRTIFVATIIMRHFFFFSEYLVTAWSNHVPTGREDRSHQRPGQRGIHRPRFRPERTCEDLMNLAREVRLGVGKVWQVLFADVSRRLLNWPRANMEQFHHVPSTVP